MLLADRAEELNIARSLGAAYRALERVAETKIHTSRKVKTVVRRVRRKMDVAAVHRHAARVRRFINGLLAAKNKSDAAAKNNSSATPSTTEEAGAPDGFTVTVDAKETYRSKKVESLEKELAELKAMMAQLAREKEVWRRKPRFPLIIVILLVPLNATPNLTKTMRLAPLHAVACPACSSPPPKTAALPKKSQRRSTAHSEQARVAWRFSPPSSAGEAT